MAKNISRKEFLKATAMSAAGIGLLGAGVLNAKAEEEKPAHKKFQQVGSGQPEREVGRGARYRHLRLRHGGHGGLYRGLRNRPQR